MVLGQPRATSHEMRLATNLCSHDLRLRNQNGARAANSKDPFQLLSDLTLGESEASLHILHVQPEFVRYIEIP